MNPRSGGGSAARARIADRAREREIEVEEFGAGLDLAAMVDEARSQGADLLGVAGGDGSLATVAAAASAHELPFICLPAGTRNHFARDLGLDPDDPVAALDAFTDPVEGRIDLGEVNGRPFLNLVSLGIYGEAVRQSAYRDAKVRTLLETARRVLGPGGEIPELDLVDDLGAEHRHPAIVLVSNNPYGLSRPMEQGARPRLDGGRLGVMVIDPPPIHGRPPARAWDAHSLEVRALASVHAGVDGEAVELTPPLRFGIRPRALRVRIPRRSIASGRPSRSAARHR